MPMSAIADSFGEASLHRRLQMGGMPGGMMPPGMMGPGGGGDMPMLSAADQARLKAESSEFVRSMIMAFLHKQAGAGCDWGVSLK